KSVRVGIATAAVGAGSSPEFVPSFGMMVFRSLLHFFFQAEDGIRDFHVTGVQTCALPICSARRVSITPKPIPLPPWLATPEGLLIGRASCRERVEIAGGGASFRKKPVGRSVTGRCSRNRAW